MLYPRRTIPVCCIVFGGAALLSVFDGCNILKIDVEGHEKQVFRSCVNAFQHIRPRAIVFEEHGSKAAPDGSIGMLLSSIGYRVFGNKKYLIKLRL
jgi:hypothetical protein